MKAAVLHAFGETPRYEDFPEPVADPEDVEIEPRAVALENVDAPSPPAPTTRRGTSCPGSRPSWAETGSASGATTVP